MPVLVIRLRGTIITTIELDPQKEYIAGRKEGCDILLESEKGVSREHFKIYFGNNKWVVELISKYGDVFYYGNSASKITLKETDTFSVPPYDFDVSPAASKTASITENSAARILSSSSSPKLQQSKSAKKETAKSVQYRSETKNKLTNTESHAHSLIHNSDSGTDKTVVGHSMLVPYIKIMSRDMQAKDIIRLEGGNTWLAGRESICAIHIRDQRVSRRQFEIQEVEGQYFIVDLGSVNGTILNGNQIASSTPTILKSGDAISVLDNYIYFELHDSVFNEKVRALEPLPNLERALSGQTAHQIQKRDPNQLANQTGGGPLAAFPESGLPANLTGIELVKYRIRTFDYKKNRKFLVGGVVAFLILLVVFGDNSSDDPKVPTNKVDPILSKLTPEKQHLVKQTYMLSKTLYMQQKYELAQAELDKIFDLAKDLSEVQELRRLCNEAIALQNQIRDNQAREQAKKDAEEKIIKQVELCRTKLNPKIEEAEMEDCLTSAIQLNPEHPLILEIRQKVQQIIEERQTKATQRADYERQVEQLRGIFNLAGKIEKKGDLLLTIKAFEKVSENKSLPDPAGLRSESKRKIASLRKVISSKTVTLESSAEKAASTQDLKKAILLLREAKTIDPENEKLSEKIDKWTEDLKKQMRTLYQEGFLEESFGNVEGSESHPGAKDKWKKIIDLDIPDGEFYKKASIKLKKYGLM